jgi:TonB family protein
MRRYALSALLLCLAPAAAGAQTRTTYPENGHFTEPPQLLNRDEVAALAKASYPEAVKAEGFAGTPTVRLYVDEAGVVRTRRIDRSSAIPLLDSAALKVADGMRFAPARDGDRPTHLWVTIPVEFRIDIPAGPQPAVAPRVRNLFDVERALFRLMEQRQTRNDRAPLLAIWVAADGTPAVIELREPSGDPALDTAALKAAMMARFDPGRDAAGEPVPSWMFVTIRSRR